MIANPTKIIMHPTWIKIYAIIMGYSIWSMIANFEVVTKKIDAYVCFYDHSNSSICAPETVKITIQGPRKNMYLINKQHIAFNIDISQYQPGNHEILLEESNLFLPKPLKLIDLEQSIISISIQN